MAWQRTVRWAVVAVCAAVVGEARAALDLNAVVNPGLSGATKYDGWAGLTLSNYPGYGTFSSSASSWGGKVITSNQAGSAGGVEANKAVLSKVSGFGYPAGEGLYLGGLGNSPGGTFAITETHPVSASPATVVLQVVFGEAGGVDFTSLPTLTYNNETAVPAGAYVGGVVRSRQQNGTRFIEETGEEAPIWVNSWTFQWDTRGLGAVSDFKVQWAGEAHSQIYALRLDQASAFTAVVPEPGVLGVGVVAVVGWLGRRRR